MPYFPGMPPPRPPYEGYYSGEYDDYGSYGHGYSSGYSSGYSPGYSSGYNSGYGSPWPPAAPPRGAWRGRGEGGWGGSSAGSAVVTAKTSPAATPRPTSSTVATVVKTEPKKETVVKTEPKDETVVKTEPKKETVAPPAVAEKSTSSSASNGALSAVTAGQTAAAAAAAAAAASASNTPRVASVTVTAKASSTSTATAGKAATEDTEDTKDTVDTPLSDSHPFPESLTEQFFPNRCDLCSVVFPVARDIFIPEKGGMDYMENNLQSTMHYSGKSHKKKLRQFMQDYCRRHRLVTPRRATELMQDTPAVPRAAAAQETTKVDLYCKACDLSFTSVQHASQHYAGKNHQRKVEGKPPLKSGYFNSRTGRWQRLPPGQELERSFRGRAAQARGPVGRPWATPAATDPSVVTVQVAPGNLVNAGVKLCPAVTVPAAGTGTGVQSKFYCEICSVSATCQLQLDTHMTGSRHKLQAKKLGLAVPVDKPATAAQAGSGDAGEPAAKRPRRDYSIYKTPSGKFYCLPCDLTMNSEIQFAQHFESKKHQLEVSKKRKASGAETA